VTSEVPRGRSLARRWDDFFFADRDPRLCAVLRIAYAVLLLIDVAVWAPDLGLWFSEQGVLAYEVSRAIVDDDAVTLFALLPRELWVVWLGCGMLVAHAVLLLVGWRTRLQAVMVLVWLVSFQHRNIALVDGEDTLFRLFAFYLALAPSGWAFSLDARRRGRRGGGKSPAPRPWALRLFQIQMSVVYLSSAVEKSLGADWRSGDALYYVARLDDYFGKFPVPGFLFEALWLVRLLSWSVLLLEWLLPLALWLPRTRKAALLIGILFHLSIDYTMNLFLFHWLMIVGLLSFAEFGDLQRVAGVLRRRLRRAPSGSDAR
jgi:hypothetical protein